MRYHFFFFLGSLIGRFFFIYFFANCGFPLLLLLLQIGVLFLFFFFSLGLDCS